MPKGPVSDSWPVDSYLGLDVLEERRWKRTCQQHEALSICCLKPFSEEPSVTGRLSNCVDIWGVDKVVSIPATTPWDGFRVGMKSLGLEFVTEIRQVTV